MTRIGKVRREYQVKRAPTYFFIILHRVWNKTLPFKVIIITNAVNEVCSEQQRIKRRTKVKFVVVSRCFAVQYIDNAL